LVPAKQAEDFNIGTVPFQLRFGTNSKVALLSDPAVPTRVDYFNTLLEGKFSADDAEFQPRKPLEISEKSSG